MLKFPENFSEARVLIVNDDGIHAEGIKVLEEIMLKITPNVWVVAPENQKSAVGHSLTIHQPLRIKEYDEKHVSVYGTPTDSTLVGVQKVMRDFKPDLILSGINHGQNTADDVTYSGTISAAMEGAILEVPSIALSQELENEGMMTKQDIDWNIARENLPKLLKKLAGVEIEDNIVLSVNFPYRRAGIKPELRAIAQGHFSLKDQDMIDCIDPRGRPYFWIGPPPKRDLMDKEVDVGVLSLGHITITPLSLNLTHEPTIKFLKGVFK